MGRCCLASSKKFLKILFFAIFNASFNASFYASFLGINYPLCCFYA
ncbi:hypothetical protein HMPREF1406_00608 [Helicobacter pylori GAM239Bi]|nr:hypothetical protein HMPREF1406_00608 [Helicobacter pylori GAM239Bi]